MDSGRLEDGFGPPLGMTPRMTPKFKKSQEIREIIEIDENHIKYPGDGFGEPRGWIRGPFN